MKKLVSVFLLLTSLNLYAQHPIENATSKSIGLSVGLNQLKDKNLHPIVHNGAIYGLSYNYQKAKRHILQFNGGLQFSKPKTKFEGVAESINIQAYGSLGYLFETHNKVWITNYAGPELQASYNLSFYPNWDESHLYWADYMSLGISDKLVYQVREKRWLLLDVAMPLFFVLSRPESNRPYKLDDISVGGILSNMNSHPHFTLIHKNFVLNTQVEYQLQLNEKTTQGIFYSFGYSRLQESPGVPFQNIQHKIGYRLYL